MFTVNELAVPQVQKRGCCCAVCMGSAGGTCENEEWVDPWRRETLVACSAADAEVVADLEAQDRDCNADLILKDSFFAIEAQEDDTAGHLFYLLRAMGPVEFADERKKDRDGNEVNMGDAFIWAQYLEWDDQEQETYTVETTKTVIIPSHLVCTSPLQMQRTPNGCAWILDDSETERVMQAATDG